MGQSLLVADDSMIVREMIKDLAREAGWEVVGEAANGQQAIDQYQAHRPDVTTLDLVMPEYDGLHALRGIRQADATAKVLVVSAIDQVDVLKEALGLGAADFIVKPFAKERVLEALDLLGASKRRTSSASAPLVVATTA
jgi:two-component system chemotaxis response regulator CheY